MFTYVIVLCDVKGNLKLIVYTRLIRPTNGLRKLVRSHGSKHKGHGFSAVLSNLFHCKSCNVSKNIISTIFTPKLV